MRRRGRIELAPRQGLPDLPRRQAGGEERADLHEVLPQGGEFLLCTSCPTRSLTLLFISAPVRERGVRRRWVREQGHQVVVRVQAHEGPHHRQGPPDVRAVRQSRGTHQPTFDSLHLFPTSDPSLPLAAGTGRGRMRFVRQMQPELLEALQEAREGGRNSRSALPVPLLHRGGQGDEEGGTGGLIPLFPPDPTAASPPHHDTNTALVTRHVHPAKTRHVHNH